MRLSKKCRYGIRALIDMAANFENEYMALSVLAKRNDVSPQYLEQAFASLRRAGIVKGVKGSQGGYRLNAEPKEIRLSEIMEALDGSSRIESEELPEEGHGRAVASSIQEMIIDKMNARMEELLQETTLNDLKERYLDYREYGQGMYYI